MLAQIIQNTNCALHRHLVLDLPADLLKCLLLSFGEREFVGNRVTFGHQRAALFLGQDQRPRTLQFLQETTDKCKHCLQLCKEGGCLKNACEFYTITSFLAR